MSVISEATEGLMRAAEAKDPYSRGHGRSVALGAMTIARELGYDDSHLEALENGAFLHDVGNLQVEADILTKPGRLNSVEFQQIREHPSAGASLVSTFPDLKDMAPMIGGHHERWDGMGYPKGVKGNDIPRDARIIAVAECFDAMTSPRVHRTPFPPSRAVLGMRTAARTQLDPGMVDAFIAGIERLVPSSLLESDEGVLSLEQVVRQEKQQLRHAFTVITQSFMWMFYRLVGDVAAGTVEVETNDFFKRHQITVKLARGKMQDLSPSRASTEELADTYKLALARAYAGVEKLIGKPVASMYLRRAVDGLSEASQQVCRHYRLCGMMT